MFLTKLINYPIFKRVVPGLMRKILTILNKNRGYFKVKSFQMYLDFLDPIDREIILFQDADLEYDPQDYKKLISPFISNNADVVYGSRFQGSSAHRLIYFTHRIANAILTIFVNFLTNINFSDVETGYKVFRKSFLNKIKLEEKSFGIEIEITMKLAKLKPKIFEVGISYNGRTYAEGKKIGFKDGIVAMFLIIKYFFISAYR